jgi:hypothetical protein
VSLGIHGVVRSWVPRALEETPLKETFHFPKDLSLRIPGKEGTVCIGTVTDLRTGAGRRWVLAEFPPPGAPLFSIGDRVPLSFSGSCLDRGFSAEAEVALWSFNDAVFTYGFQVNRLTKESLLGAIHRHRARRVEFPAAERVNVSVALSTGGPVLEGQLENLSAGGLGILLSHAADGELKAAYELVLRFEVPGCEGPLELLGRTRWRSSVEGQVHYGIQFVQGLGAAEQSQLQQIERFVANWGASS